MPTVDWFQPFKHRKDISVGMLYMVVMKFPPFQQENVIIVGIIPALTKEPPSLNYFLNPLVDELNALWRGIKIKIFRSFFPGGFGEKKDYSGFDQRSRPLRTDDSH